MNLLGAANYDPTGGAVSKVTTSLVAMTALDTTNLRIAFTIPAHGIVHVRMQCIHHGSTTVAQVMLGVLEGATLRGRQISNINILQTAVATSMIRMDVNYTLTGLTPGAVNWDAAYGVEIVSSAGGAIKYGGPNNTTTNDGFGCFNFEIWDPRPIPTAAAGASGGLLISGSNAGTTTFGAMTITGVTTHTGATVHTGNVSMAAGLNITQSSSNTSALIVTGNGTGHGAVITSGTGATGDGVQVTAGSTNGNGLKLTKTGTGVALASPTSDIVLAKTTNITGFNDIAATAVVSAGAITTSGGAVSTVTAVTGAVGSVTGAVGSVTGNVGGNVVGSVATATNLTNLPTIPANWITTAGITDGALTAAKFAAASLNGKGDWNVGKTGYSLTVAPLDAAATRAAVGLASANLDTQLDTLPTAAEIVAAQLTTAITEAYRANGAAPTLAQFMSEVLAHLGEAAISGTTKTIKKFDHATTAATFNLDSATDPATIQRAS